MNYQAGRSDDPIAPELLRSRLEAIGQEAGAAVQQTAISPIVTESKDYSVTILDAEGSVISAYGLIEIHYGAVMHAVRTTIQVVHRAGGQTEPVDIHQVGLALAKGDVFEMFCASGGGYGDPLDRDAEAVHRDLQEDRLESAIASEVYGVVLTDAGDLDLAATELRREAMRRERLSSSRQPVRRVDPGLAAKAADDAREVPLYPGVVQVGNRAVSASSGACLAIAPDSWLDGCPTLDIPLDERAGGTIARAHLDPVSGRMLFVDVIRKGDGPSIAVCPDRWAKAGHNLLRD